ncbi:MAG: 4-hydroxy-tetrahydrodipicolinate reductase [Myxococcales bacterium]|nr:4-hydroxy-tetrahydrodipicolinate reductase [Myxococcales bacterium]
MNKTALKIVVPGALGRMGRAVIRLIDTQPDCALHGAIERPDHPDAGRDVGNLVLGRHLGVSLEDDLRHVLLGADAVVDFTAPEATLSHASVAAEHRVPLIIGTTGLTTEQKETIRAAAASTPIVLAPNMSIGVNLLFFLTRLVARTLAADTDVEIVETHHRHKADAPSGTALKLAEVIGEELGYENPAAHYEYGRQGRTGERESGRIGLHAVRGGDIVGLHDVNFFGAGEVLTLTHRATSRDNFAKGALRAAAWLQGKPSGLYDMGDVLGLK